MDSKKSQGLNDTSERINVGAPAEAPPSYNEAMAKSPYNLPTAPPLETESTNSSAIFPHNPYPAQGPAPVYTANDPRFAQWDDRATRILIMNRLRMNDQFNQAKNQQERDLLWNLILIDLISDGYSDLVLYSLIEYWQFIYSIYQSVANGLTSNASNDWQFFEPMHNVFGSSSGSGFTSDVLPSSTNVFPSSTINSGSSVLPSSTSTGSYIPTPVIMPTPAVAPIQWANPVAETPSTLPNQDIPSPTCPVQPVSSNATSDLPSSVQPIADTTATSTNVSSVGETMQTTAETAASERLSSLGQTSGGNADLETSSLLPNSSNGIALSNTPAADVVSASAVTPSLADHVSSADVLTSGDTTTNLLSGIDTTSNNIGSDVITNQPTESLLPTLLNDQVITTQPTFSSPPLTTDNTTDADGCCGDDACCCDDGCCGGDGDYCTGCDDCGDCGDCSLD